MSIEFDELSRVINGVLARDFPNLFPQQRQPRYRYWQVCTPRKRLHFCYTTEPVDGEYQAMIYEGKRSGKSLTLKISKPCASKDAAYNRAWNWKKDFKKKRELL